MSVLSKKAFQRFGPIYRDPIPRFHVGARQRSFLTDNSLSLSDESSDSPEISVVDGFNFRFDFDGDATWLYFYDDFLNAYLLTVSNSGTQYEITSAAMSSLSPIPPPVFGGNYTFHTDNYLRFVDFSTSAAHYLIVNSGDGTLSIEAPPGKSPRTADLATATYMTGMNFTIVDGYFYFKDELGNRWLPTIIEEALGVFSIQLTAA